VAGQGERFGPDLSKIGSIRAPRDLLESIVFPSASIVRSFEPYTVVTKAGRSYNGLIKLATAEAVTLVTTERAVTRLPRTEIDVMPGVDHAPRLGHSINTPAT
jgi:putative heme-binding domain-containing protein